jgi:uncharacterized protein (DUF58 family)
MKIRERFLNRTAAKVSGVRPARMVSANSLLFIAFTVIIAMAGLNTGNNLLYLIAGVMLGMVLASLIAGRMNLARIAVTRQLPRHAFAHTPFIIRLEIINNKKIWNSFGIILENGSGPRESLFVFSLDSEGKQIRETEHVIPRRGRYHLPPVIVHSAFPLGLFTFKRELSEATEMIIYPHIHDSSEFPEGSNSLQDDFPHHDKGAGSGLYGIREYRHGEEAAGISWKLSAKLDKLMVRETEREEKRRVCIVLDNALKNDSADDLEAFERAVSDAASLVWHLSKNAFSIKLVTHRQVVGYGEGIAHTHKLLTTLALLTPVVKPEEIDITRTSILEGGTGILVTCRTDASPRGAQQNTFAHVITERIGAEHA